MQKISDQPEFIKTIGEIKGAEEEYDRLIKEAREKADKMVRQAKEKIIAESTKASQEMVDFKNARLQEGSRTIEGKVQKLIQKAKDDGSKLSKKKLESAKVSKLVKNFLNSL